MNSIRMASVGAALMLVMGFAIPTYVSAADVDIVDKIKTAKTAADHEAIASYYDAEAAAAKQSAEMHRKMASTYTVGGTAGKGTTVNLPQHCQNLAKESDEEAANFEALAKAHREMAKAAK